MPADATLMPADASRHSSRIWHNIRTTTSSRRSPSRSYSGRQAEARSRRTSSAYEQAAARGPIRHTTSESLAHVVPGSVTLVAIHAARAESRLMGQTRSKEMEVFPLSQNDET